MLTAWLGAGVAQQCKGHWLGGEGRSQWLATCVHTQLTHPVHTTTHIHTHTRSHNSLVLRHTLICSHSCTYAQFPCTHTTHTYTYTCAHTYANIHTHCALHTVLCLLWRCPCVGWTVQTLKKSRKCRWANCRKAFFAHSIGGLWITFFHRCMWHLPIVMSLRSLWGIFFITGFLGIKWV